MREAEEVLETVKVSVIDAEEDPLRAVNVVEIVSDMVFDGKNEEFDCESLKDSDILSLERDTVDDVVGDAVADIVCIG